MDKLEGLVALASLPGLGSVKVRLLLQHFGSAEDALKASESDLRALPGFSETLAQGIIQERAKKAWETDLELVERHKVQLIPFDSMHYPKRLLDVSDHPVVLYVKGALLHQDHHGLAVVGTRHATLYGKEMARKISRDLAAMDVTVVSGLARGVDTEAHTGALETGRTVAVIGSGLTDIYPRENERLADLITEHGALISEFPMATPPDRQNFPQRNRIVAGMTRGTLLIEAPHASGAMITMHKALALGRPLYALPGRVDVDSFKGNHALIKEGRAHLVEGVEDIGRHFGELFGPATLRSFSPQAPLEGDEQRLFEMINGEERSIEQLAASSQLSPMKLNVLLMSLVLKKRIKEFPGKLYRRINTDG